MKDQILREMGFISDAMLEEITGYSAKTRESYRKHNTLPYVLWGKEYIYPIDKLKDILKAKMAKRYARAGVL